MGKVLALLVIFALLRLLYAAGEKPPCRAAAPSSRELAGIWRQATAEPLVGYLYFAGDGAVYYMASRIPATQAMFTDKFKLTDSRSDRAFSSWEYAPGRETDGRLFLAVTGEAIGGRYYKIS